MPQGFVLWFTGLSGSGKSTLTAMVAAELRRRGVHVETLDGDEIRKNLSRGLGFSREDRDANIRRIGFVAKLIARSGACAIAAAISPYRDVRDEVRRSVDRFCEVYCECSLDVLAERDPKGLYKKALAGEIQHFTGVDDPYEAPKTPEVHVHSDRETPEESVRKILGKLEELGFIRADAAGGGLAAPHGGDLVDRTLRDANAARSRLEALPAIELDASAELDLACLASGAFSPLTGFMIEKDYLRVAREQRLENGLVWPVPVTLGVPEALEAPVRKSGAAALRSANGAALGFLEVHDLWRRPDGALCAGGNVSVFTAPESSRGESGAFAATQSAHRDAAVFESPHEARRRMRASGWQRVIAWPAGEPPLIADEYVARAALEHADGLVMHPFTTAESTLPAELLVACYRALADGYFARERTLVAALRLARRSPLLDAIVAKNYGATHVLSGQPIDDELGITPARNELGITPARDELGITPLRNELGITPARNELGIAALRNELGITALRNELGITALRNEPAFFSKRLGALATARTAPDSGTVSRFDDVRGALARGETPCELRPEVVELLRAHFQRRTA